MSAVERLFTSKDVHIQDSNDSSYTNINQSKSMLKNLLKLINKQHSNDHSLVGAIEEIMRPNANSIMRDEWQPFHRFPDVKHVRVDLKPLDRIFELFGIKRRKGPAEIHYMKYKNKPINRFALRQIKRLQKADSKKYWIIVDHLMRRSNVFFMLALYHIFPRWHRDLHFQQVINLHRKYKRVAKKPEEIDFKRVYIPKDEKGNMRPLGVPKPEWRMYLHLLNQFLVLRFDKTISPNQHGFRPGRGTLTAWKEILQSHSKYKYIYEFDYRKFFDSLNQSMISEALLLHHKVPRKWWTLIEKLNTSQPKLPDVRLLDEKEIENNKIVIREGIRDNYIRLYNKLVRVGFGGNHTLYGIPQGAPTSPFLSIMLLDYVTQQDRAYPDTKWIRYADDGIVMMNKPIELTTDKPNADEDMLDNFKKRRVLEMMEASNIRYSEAKCRWVKYDGKWLTPLKFLGLEFDGESLSAKTRGDPALGKKGSTLVFDKHNLVKEYLAREWKTKSVEFSWSYLARSDIFGFFQARLYQGDYNLKEYSQDFKLKFSPGSWTDHYCKWLEKLERGSKHDKFIAKLTGIHLTVFNSTSLCLQSGLEAIKEAERSKYKRWPEGPLYEINNRKQIEWHFRNEIRDAREAGDINKVSIIGYQWSQWESEQPGSKSYEPKVSDFTDLRNEIRNIINDTSITTISKFLDITKWVPTQRTYPKKNRGVSKRYYHQMIRPEVNAYAKEKAKNLLLLICWTLIGVIISVSLHFLEMKETENIDMKEVASEVVPEIANSNSAILIAVMLLAILTIIYIHSATPTEAPSHWAERLSQGYSGPLTSEEMLDLKAKLSVQALADNLAISPIGDLWQSPW